MNEIVITPQSDLYIARAEENKNFGDAQYLFVSRFTNEDDIYRSMIKFDFRGVNERLPSNAKLESAVLQLTICRNDVDRITNSISVRVHPLSADFDMSTAMWNTQPEMQTQSVAELMIDSGYIGEAHVDITDLAQGWFDGSIKNHGIMLCGNENESSIVAFTGMRFGDSSTWPLLILKFAGTNLKDQGTLQTFWELYKFKKNYFQSFLQAPFSQETEMVAKLIKGKKYKGIIVYPTAVFWEPIQRPQQILKEFAKRGYLCFFCDPYNEQFSAFEVYENLIIVNQEGALLPLLRTKTVIVLCSWLIQMAWADLLPNKVLWYDILDQLEFFTMYDQGMLEKHNQVQFEAEILTYSAHELKKYVSGNPNAIYLPNACNYEDFNLADNQSIPNSIAQAKAAGKKIIGYFGAVEEWFDTDLINTLAQKNPSWHFFIIGKCGITTDKFAMENIELTGLLPYDALYQYARHFDVGIIPFIVSELTNAVSPVKFFEYSSLGIPVVSSPISEMRDYACDWVGIAQDSNSFEKHIKRCLDSNIKELAYHGGKKFAMENQWSNRVDIIENALALNPLCWKVYSNIWNASCANVMAVAFLDFDGKNFFAGGAERYLLDLADVFRAHGITLNIYQYGKSTWMRRMSGMNIISLAQQKEYTSEEEVMDNHLLFNRAFYDISNESTAVNLYSAFWLGIPYNAKPSIGISHGVSWDYRTCKFYDGNSFWLNNGRYIDAARQSDLMISVDTNTANWFQTIDYDVGMNTVVIPNYVNLNQFKPAVHFEKQDDKVVILYPRRLYDARGFYLVLEILDTVLSKYPFVDFHFVGRGTKEDTENLLKKISAWGERIKWYSLLPEEMPKAYQQADITLIPTLYSEGTSLSCLEAMASGNAIIATRIGGLSDLVISGYNGYLINPHADELLWGIENLLADKNQMAYFKNNGVQIAQAFSKEKWERAWSSIIQAYALHDTVSPPSRLVSLYLDQEANWDFCKLGKLIGWFLENGDIVYIRVKNHGKAWFQSFGRIQWLEWDEEDLQKPDFILADEKSAEDLVIPANIIISRNWLDEFCQAPQACFQKMKE